MVFEGILIAVRASITMEVQSNPRQSTEFFTSGDEMSYPLGTNPRSSAVKLDNHTDENHNDVDARCSQRCEVRYNIARSIVSISPERTSAGAIRTGGTLGKVPIILQECALSNFLIL